MRPFMKWNLSPSKSVSFRAGTLLASLFLAACSQGRLEVDVNKSVQTNANAADHIAWESSDYHPTALFGKWHMDKADQKEVCDTLLARTDEELTLFEEEFKKPANKSLISSCKEELMDRLETHWKVADAALEEVSLSFKFKPTLETRDFSAGYTAFTGDVAPKEIVLTFDDGPHGEYTSSILDTLDKTNAKAMFFEMGKNVRLHPELSRKVAEGGHLVGSHSNTHLCLPSSDRCQTNNKGVRLTYAQAVADIMAGHQAVYDAIGWVDPIFRFPYGENTPELKAFLKSKGVGNFSWNMDSEDWRSQPVERVVENSIAQVRKQGRGVILFHDIQHRTTLALPRFLSKLYFEGFNVVVVNSQTAMKDRKNSALVKLKPNLP